MGENDLGYCGLGSSVKGGGGLTAKTEETRRESILLVFRKEGCKEGGERRIVGWEKELKEEASEKKRYTEGGRKEKKMDSAPLQDGR